MIFGSGVIWELEKHGVGKYCSLLRSKFLLFSKQTTLRSLTSLCSLANPIISAHIFYAFKHATTRRAELFPMKNFWRIFGFVVVMLGLSKAMIVASQLQWHEENGFRWADLPKSSGEKAGFIRLTPEQTGIYFTNQTSDFEIAKNRMLADGSGVAVGDVDNDGLPDIFFAELNGNCVLYKNLGGYKFKNITATSGIVCTNLICRGAVFADINGDRWLDLLITTTGNGVLVFSNKHDGTFANVSRGAGLLSDYGASSLALADVDGNGTLDVYVANRRKLSLRDRADISVQMVDGKISIPDSLRTQLTLSTHGVVLEYGDPDQFYLNDGKGTFTPLSWTNGAFLDEKGKPLTDAPRDWGLGAMFHDVNGDGAPDLYVCNDFWSPDRFWINDGSGHFRAASDQALRHTSASSMGVDFSDVDRDGNVDFMVVDMLSRDWSWRKRQKPGLNADLIPAGETNDRPQVVRNTFFHNRGDGTFAEIAGYAGIAGSEWAWQPVFMDVDLDGWDDILVITGFHRDIQDRDMIERYSGLQRTGRLLPPKLGFDGKPVKRTRQELITDGNFAIYSLENPLAPPIVGYRNLGGSKFNEVGPQWGLSAPAIRTGIALGDLNGSGNLDFVVNAFRGPAEIYRHNITTAPRMAVRVKGLAPNTQGIGAKIKLLNGALPMQSAEVISGGYYLSGADPLRVFAAGNSTNMTLEITWRNGKVSTIQNVKPDREYEIDEAGAIASTRNEPVEKVQPLFEDVSSLIAHQHHEEFFNDYERQPLLPRQLSQDGPGVAWAKLDGSGHEALVIGSGRGGRLETFSPDGSGNFIRAQSTFTSADDLTGIAGWVQPDGKRALLIGQANYEAVSNQLSAIVCSRDAGRINSVGQLPATTASTGPITVADIDGDGDLDVFVGGRVIAGRYPESTDSKIFRNVGGQLQLDAENSRVLEKVGLVSGAVWSDLDSDGFPELILACEWGPIRVFKNERGQLHETTKKFGLDKHTGWWRGVTTGDLDGDGRLDIIASNWGLNSDYSASPDQPAQLYYSDSMDRGDNDLIETAYDAALRAVVPRRDRQAMGLQFPFFVKTFATHKEYGEATMERILAALPKPFTHIQANTLASTVFFNRTNYFQAEELPIEAQLAPAFGVNVADFDGDGNEDVFLSQNFSQVYPEDPRLDAGRGLLLRGLGGGKLEAVSGQHSGISIYGGQRGSAAGDFNGDGRMDLVVAQNAGETRLYKNIGAKPGLRVRLIGPTGNPDGVGATMRLIFGERSGPAREIHGGSGYWSQDSAIQILCGAEVPTQIWIRWPGGKMTTSAVPNVAKEITVNPDGKVTVER